MSITAALINLDTNEVADLKVIVDATKRPPDAIPVSRWLVEGVDFDRAKTTPHLGDQWNTALGLLDCAFAAPEPDAPPEENPDLTGLSGLELLDVISGAQNQAVETIAAAANEFKRRLGIAI